MAEDREAVRNTLLSFSEGQEILAKYRFVQPPQSSGGHQVEPLGRGGSGVVFLVEQALYQHITVKRAIKFYVFRDDIALLTAHRPSGPISASNFKNEILNLAGFNHENILKVIEAGLYAPEDAGHSTEIPFLVTDFIEGITLEKAIASRSLANAIEHESRILIDVILQMCRGLGHLHAREFYHCDIAPKNIFVGGTANEPQLVIGDLGTGRTLSVKSPQEELEQIFVAGSKEYCPVEVREVLNKEIPFSELRNLQPRWDLYGLAKTCLELVMSLRETSAQRPAWMEALKTTLRDAMEGNRFHMVAELAQRVRWLHPMEHTTWEVPELSENAPGTHRSLLPIQSVVASPRVQDLMHHRALLRLKRVPQLVMASRIFHGGNHNRYEHTLGVYQNTRQYLLALLNDDHFLTLFSPDFVELALVSALLCNIARFPFSTIVHELHAKDRTLFAGFSRMSMLTELLTWRANKEGGMTFQQTICESFPQVDLAKLKHILAEGPLPHPEAGVRFIRYLFNSSIDARVIDYVRRDSHHLGMYKGDAFELQNLLPHIRFRNGQMVVLSTGLSAVEEIITLRYWLFNRIYWNRPNRTMIAMLKFVLLALHGVDEFPQRMREAVLSGSEDTMLEFFHLEADRSSLPHVRELCAYLMPERPLLYEELLQFNRSDGDANARQLCDRYQELSLADEVELQSLVNAHFVKAFRLSSERQHILLDLPVEYGPKKLGEDVNIANYKGEPRALTKVSGIVEGVQKGFTEHLQRLRVFVHPETWATLEHKRKEIKDAVGEVLLSLI